MCGHFSSQEKIYALQLMLEKYYTHYEVKELLDDVIKELKYDKVGIVDIVQEETEEGSSITYVLNNGKSKTITVKNGDIKNFKYTNSFYMNNDGALALNVVDDAEQDNTKPITSSGVYTIVGNIDALLNTI